MIYSKTHFTPQHKAIIIYHHTRQVITHLYILRVYDFFDIKYLSFYNFCTYIKLSKVYR